MQQFALLDYFIYFSLKKTEKLKFKDYRHIIFLVFIGYYNVGDRFFAV